MRTLYLHFVWLSLALKNSVALVAPHQRRGAVPVGAFYNHWTSFSVVKFPPHSTTFCATSKTKRRRSPPTTTSTSSTSGVISSALYSTEDDESDSSSPVPSSDKKSIWGCFKNTFSPSKEKDGLTTKQRLAKMGLSALLSYGWVSNMSYSVSISLAWYGFSKKTRLSPLAPGQWKPFLGVYAGFYVFNNIIRPVRVGMAVAISTKFDAAVRFIENRLKCKRSVAIGIMVIFANVVGTLAAMALGISIASTASGVPIFTSAAATN